MARLNALNLEEVTRARSVVLAQPHRNGRDDPWLASALGRFFRETSCGDQRIMDGVVDYAEAKRKWSIAKGRPRGFEAVGPAGCGPGPSSQQVDRWQEKITRVHTEIVSEFGSFVMSQIHRLAVEDMDLRADTLKQNAPVILSALGQVAVVTGHMQRNPHPFKAAGVSA